MTRMRPAGLRVCTSCFDEFKRNLTSFPRLYRQCEEMLTVSPQKGEKVSRQLGRGISLNSSAVDARDVLRARLLAWSDLVAAEQSCAAPDRSVDAMAAFLHRHAHWLCAHAAAGDIVAEIAETTAKAKRAAYPHRTRKFRVGGCVEPQCDGSLVAVIQPHEQLLPSEVRCDIDPEHSWPAHRWRELDRRVGRQNATGGDRWLTVVEVSKLWGLSTSNVYRLASVNSWRRRANGRRVYYYEADVLQSVG
ncbi:helix-turn-helix transcriptional regulator [Streptomyces sp. NPDC020951]|uniref:helix-turn-helix transcriptional regulator n=1 Tax=Streptomyces sp. NPDC020951 TaxID=3365104 RepID=UPI00378E413F